MNQLYEIEGMRCESCTTQIAKALQSVAGVTSARVTLSPPQADLSISRDVPLGELQNALGRAGDYRIHLDGVSNFSKSEQHAVSDASKESLYPLVLIVAYLLGTVLLMAYAQQDYSFNRVMTHFMGGFFLVFSFFKLLDLRGFADAYRSYDVLARAIPAWSYAYPFVELGLGMAYVLGWSLVVTNIVTLVVMLVGSVGVLRALLGKKRIRCACLGTALNLPMTTITLVEDLGMAAMATLMLFRMT